MIPRSLYLILPSIWCVTVRRVIEFPRGWIVVSDMSENGKCVVIKQWVHNIVVTSLINIHAFCCN